MISQLADIGKELRQGVRNLVSQNRRRLCYGTLDLDLSYVTGSIIAFAVPVEGFKSAIRNSSDELAKFFNERHAGHYKIFNTSLQAYDTGKFETNSVVHVGWPDHHNPPLGFAIYVVHSMYKFLRQDPSNVVAIHCVAGKGRTGCIIAMLLLYIQVKQRSEDALLHFTIKRIDTGDGDNSTSLAGDGSDIGGVRNPSQLRYTKYLEQILYQNYKPSGHAIRLVRIEILECSLLKGMIAGEFPFVVVNSYINGVEEEVFSSQRSGRCITFSAGDSNYTIQIEPALQLKMRDYVVRIKYPTPIGTPITLAWTGFHTSMLPHSPSPEPALMRWTKRQLDEAFKSKITVPDSFQVSFAYVTDFDEPPASHFPWDNLLQQRAQMLAEDQPKGLIERLGSNTSRALLPAL